MEGFWVGGRVVLAEVWGKSESEQVKLSVGMKVGDEVKAAARSGKWLFLNRGYVDMDKQSVSLLPCIHGTVGHSHSHPFTRNPTELVGQSGSCTHHFGVFLASGAVIFNCQD